MVSGSEPTAAVRLPGRKLGAMTAGLARWYRFAFALVLVLLIDRDPSQVVRGWQAEPTLLKISATPWNASGAQPGVRVDPAGAVTDPDGATVKIAAPPTVAVATTSTRVAAESLRGRRLSLSGELSVENVGAGASLWMRVDAGSETLVLDNGISDALVGTAGLSRRTVSAVVPRNATTVVMGLMLRGGGTMTARNVRLAVIDPATTPMSKAAAEMIDRAIDVAKNSAFKAPDVDWAAVEPDVRAFAAGASTTAETYPAIRYLLTSLGDRHSFLMLPAQATANRTGAIPNPPPAVRALPGKMGLISVGGYGGGGEATKAYAQRAHELIAETMPNAPCGWVIDLRDNTGGNMWPMLSALKPFLGDAGLGSFEGRGGNSTQWIAGQYVGVDPPGSLRALESSWVAVLTGPRTASSGEAVAIAFRGRPNTRSFGQGTAGLSTANSSIPLPDGSWMVLTTAIDLDRNGNKYGGVVTPDETVAEGSAASAVDPAIAAATSWLRTASHCGSSY